MKKLLFIALGLLPATHAYAARPFVTDDARLTTSGSCQFESWSRVYQDSVELWALPACNPFGNLEVTMGAGLAREFGEKTTHDYVLQLKTLFKELETNGWGVGVAAGTIQHPGIKPGPNQIGNTYAYVPYSASFMDDEVIVHANVGWLRDKDTHQDRMTWGLGSEIKLTQHLLGIAEAFGDNKASPYMQVGVRYSVIPNLLQVDGTVGHKLSGSSEDNWLSFGVRITPDHIF